MSANIESDGYPITVIGDHLLRPVRILERGLVPRLTLVHPVASAAASDSSSRIPPDSSIRTWPLSSLTTSPMVAALDPREESSV